MPAAYALFYGLLCSLAIAAHWRAPTSVPAEAPTTETPTDTDEAI